MTSICHLGTYYTIDGNSEGVTKSLSDLTPNELSLLYTFIRASKDDPDPEPNIAFKSKKEGIQAVWDQLKNWEGQPLLYPTPSGPDRAAHEPKTAPTAPAPETKAARKAAEPKATERKNQMADQRAKVTDNSIIVCSPETKVKNPRRSGTHGHNSLEIVRKSQGAQIRVGDFLAKGGRRVDMNWDIDKGNLTVVHKDDPVKEKPVKEKPAKNPAKAPADASKATQDQAPSTIKSNDDGAVKNSA